MHQKPFKSKKTKQRQTNADRTRPEIWGYVGAESDSGDADDANVGRGVPVARSSNLKRRRAKMSGGVPRVKVLVVGDSGESSTT